MRTTLLLASVLTSALFASGCGSASGLQTTASEVAVTDDDMVYRLSRGEAFGDTYMVFGGISLGERGSISSIALSGLAMQDARPIHGRYPDFHECHSAGASLAQGAIQHLNVVPADEDVREELVRCLSLHEESLADGAERVSVRLRGDVLALESATLAGEDVTHQLPRGLPHDYFLVESAQIVDTQAALAGR